MMQFGAWSTSSGEEVCECVTKVVCKVWQRLCLLKCDKGRVLAEAVFNQV